MHPESIINMNSGTDIQRYEFSVHSFKPEHIFHRHLPLCLTSAVLTNERPLRIGLICAK